MLITLVDFLPIMGSHCRLKGASQLAAAQAMASGNASCHGINWSEAVCIDYHEFIGLDRRDPPVQGRKPTD